MPPPRVFQMFFFDRQTDRHKEKLFIMLILVHVWGHIVVADASHFLEHSWERCCLNLCAHQKYANFMYSVLMSY